MDPLELGKMQAEKARTLHLPAKNPAKHKIVPISRTQFFSENFGYLFWLLTCRCPPEALKHRKTTVFSTREPVSCSRTLQKARRQASGFKFTQQKPLVPAQPSKTIRKTATFRHRLRPTKITRSNAKTAARRQQWGTARNDI